MRTTVLRVSLALALSFSSVTFAQTLSTPLPTDNAISGAKDLPSEEVEKLLAPVERWRQRALEQSAVPDEQASALEDYAVLRDGLAFDIRGRDLASEFLATLSSARVDAAFNQSTTVTPRRPNILHARYAWAKAVLARPELVASSSRAKFEAGLMAYIESGPEQAATYWSTEPAPIGTPPDEFAVKSQRALAAVTQPSSVEDFVAANEILDTLDAWKYDHVSRRAAFTVLDGLESLGSSALQPRDSSGNNLATATAIAHAAEIVNDKATLALVDSVLPTLKDQSPDAVTELEFWITRNHYDTNEFDDAIERSNRILFEGHMTLASARAAVTLGDSLRAQNKFLEAAQAYLDAKDIYGEAFPQVLQAANDGLKISMNAGHLTEPLPQGANRKTIKDAIHANVASLGEGRR